MLQIAIDYKPELIAFLEEQAATNAQALVDILTKEKVCSSTHEAKLVIVPALVHGSMLEDMSPSDEEEVSQAEGRLAPDKDETSQAKGQDA